MSTECWSWWLERRCTGTQIGSIPSSISVSMWRSLRLSKLQRKNNRSSSGQLDVFVNNAGTFFRLGLLTFIATGKLIQINSYSGWQIGGQLNFNFCFSSFTRNQFFRSGLNYRLFTSSLSKSESTNVVELNVAAMSNPGTPERRPSLYGIRHKQGGR